MNRVVIFGAPGSGKSTLAVRLAEMTGAELLERDALGVLGSEIYRATVDAAVQQDRWIFDGAPYFVDDVVYARADTVIILDFPKTLIMWRVITRSVSLIIRRRSVGAHRPAGLRSWLDTDHPVRIAWTRYADRRQEARALLRRPDLRQADIVTFTRPCQLADWLAQLPNTGHGPRRDDPT